jgi:hypothetical protein
MSHKEGLAIVDECGTRLSGEDINRAWENIRRM